MERLGGGGGGGGVYGDSIVGDVIPTELVMPLGRSYNSTARRNELQRVGDKNRYWSTI